MLRVVQRAWPRLLVSSAVLALAPAACRSHPAALAPTASSAATDPGAAALAAAPAAGPSAQLRAGPAVRVSGAAEPGGEVAISVQNRAPEPVQLATALSVERRAEQGFAALPGAQVALPASAGSGCVELAPGAELRPAPWRGAAADARAGTYRFVLHGCDRSYRIDGEPFELK